MKKNLKREMESMSPKYDLAKIEDDQFQVVNEFLETLNGENKNDDEHVKVAKEAPISLGRAFGGTCKCRGESCSHSAWRRRSLAGDTVRSREEWRPPADEPAAAKPQS